MAADLGRNTYIRQRDDIHNPLKLVDSELEEECYHSPNWVMAGKAKQKHKGGVKQVSSSHVAVRRQNEPATLMQNAPTSPEVPALIVEEWYCAL